MNSPTPLHVEYLRLFAALGNRGARFCLLRPAAGMDRPLPDLDLLMSPDDRSVAEDVFRQLGYVTLRTERFNPGKSVHVRWDGQQQFVLDVHYAVVIRGLEYLDARRVVASSVRRDGVHVAAAADLAVILFVHDIVGKQRLQAKYRDVLRSLWPVVSGSSAEADAHRHGYDNLLPQSIDELETLFVDINAQHKAAALKAALLTDEANRRRQRRMRWHRRLASRPTGISIALFGPDGSGKSTTIECLEEILKKELHWKAATVYMGPWGHDVLDWTSRLRSGPPPTLQELLARRRGLISAGTTRPGFFEASRLELRRRLRGLGATDEERRPVLRDTAMSWIVFRWLRGHLLYWAFLTILVVEMHTRHRQVRRLKRQGYVVLCDRYVHDLLTGEMHRINPRYSWVRSFVCRLVPATDIQILLWNDAEVLLARKKQLSPERLGAFLDFYERLAVQFSFERVLTDVAPVEVAHRIIELIYVRTVARLRT